MSRAEQEAVNDEAGVSFDPGEIRGRLPSNLSSRQERALIAAVRNPDAPVQELANATAVRPAHVCHALDSLACGVIGGTNTGEWIESRGGARKADTYGELTEKQAAVVDALARNPKVEDAIGRMSNKELHAAVESVSDDMPAMHYTYPADVADTYESLIGKRRQYLVESGELDLGTAADEFEPTTDEDVPGVAESPRGLLERSGFDLPDENLDSLAEVGEALTDEDRLDVAFERAADLSDEREAETDEGDDVARVPLGEVRDVRAVDDYADGDVKLGTPYWATVNGTVDWGVWFTLAGDPHSVDDVSGVVPVELLEPHGYEPRDFQQGDEAVVIPRGQSNVGDGKVRHRLELAQVYDGGTGGETETDYVPEAAAGGPPHPHDQSEAAYSRSRHENGGTGGVSDAGTDTAEDTDETESEQDADTRAENEATVESLDEWLDSRPDGMGDTVLDALREQNERLDALERENERLREQVESHEYALPDDETAEELNEAAETILDADLDKIPDREAFLSLADDVAELDRRLTAVRRGQEQNDDLDRLADRLEHVEAEFDGKVSGLRHDVASVLDRLDELEQAVERGPSQGDREVTVGEAIDALREAGVDAEFSIGQITTDEQ